MENLMEYLRSTIPAIRDKASLDFMNYVTVVKSILISQIQNPDNKNHTGTMIYALSSVNCEDLITSLFETLVNSGFETANVAYIILKQQEFDISESDNLAIEKILLQYLSVKRESDFGSERDEMIKAVIFRHFPNITFEEKVLSYLSLCKTK